MKKLLDILLGRKTFIVIYPDGEVTRRMRHREARFLAEIVGGEVCHYKDIKR